MPFVGQAKGKGVYGRYHSVYSNFANLNPCTGYNATVSVCVGGLYPNVAIYYNKVYSECCIYNHLAWAGCVAYPYMGAMRRPEYRDGRE